MTLGQGEPSVASKPLPCLERRRLQRESTADYLSETARQLRRRGFVTFELPSDIAASLLIDSKACQEQLDLCSKQPILDTCSRYRRFLRKQRLELRFNSNALLEDGPLLHLRNRVGSKFEPLADTLMTQLAITLSIPPTAFHSITEKHLTHHTLGTQREKESSSAVEVVHYMSAYGCGLAPHASANCAGHIDKGLLTFIYADTEQGLQIQGADKLWRQLLIPKGHVAVLAGYTLERATCGLVKAASHRVVMGSGGCLTARNALIFKYRALDQAVIDLHAVISKAYSKAYKGKLDSRYKESIVVKDLMEFFKSNSASVNAPWLDEYGRPHFPELVVDPQGVDHILIFVEDCCGTTSMVQMPLDAPISLLCDAYEAQRGYPKDIPLRWRWSGMIMDRRRSCREMNIQKEATIRLSLPLLGD